MLISASALTLQLFEIRPIWSRNAVKANISVHPDKLKVLLPFVAYYMVSVRPPPTLLPTRVVLIPDVTSEPQQEQAALSQHPQDGLLKGLYIF